VPYTSLLTSGSDKDLSTDVTVYPNPNTGKFALIIDHLNGSEMEIEITDGLGRNIYYIYEESPTPGNYHRGIILHDITPGIYCLRVRMENGLYIRKIIIE
jgi:hypothetical protein